MVFLHIPKCKPFYKFSLLALQVQIGIKCNLASTKSFGLSNLKTNIKDSFGFPESVYEILSMTTTQNSTDEEICKILPVDSPMSRSIVEPGYDSRTATVVVETIIGAPPSPPEGYVLWQRQPLREETDAWARPLAAPIVVLDGFEFVRVEDLAIPDRPVTRKSPDVERSKETWPLETPEELFEKAHIKEFVYTGNREQDSEALRYHIDACGQAVRSLDPTNKWARSPDRFKLKMDMTVMLESLKEEYELLVNDADDGGYYGLHEGVGSLVEFPRREIRPRGYRWTCPGWL